MLTNKDKTFSEDLSICEECRGEGTVKIYNVYDPHFVEVEVCPACKGVGVKGWVFQPAEKNLN